MLNYIQLFGIIFIINFFSFFSLAPWLPTKTNDLKRINKIVGLKQGEKFVEIGCGTANVSLFLAQNNPNNKIIGIELSPLFYLISKIKVYFSKQKNIKIIYGNALKLDFKNYDIFYVFGLPDTIKNKILPKLKLEMNQNSRFFSYCFKMENPIFTEIIHKESKNANTIYEYIK